VPCTAENFKKAVVAGNAEQVRDMVRAKVDVNQKYQAGLTALHFAAIHNRAEVARVLKSAGADLVAETTDEARLTAAALANVEGYMEVVDVICEEPADFEEPNPLRTRFLGLGLILTLGVVDAAAVLFLLDHETRWEGWQDAPPVISTSLGYKAIALGLLCLCLAMFAVTNALDPGTVDQDAVAYVHQLRSLPSEQLQLMGSEGFAILRNGKADPKHTYRWCRTCKLWRPPDVSHCQFCKRCFWRFDHHCNAVGNCIALRNHRFFMLGLLSGSTAWIMGDVGVIMRLHAHGALASPDVWWPLSGPLAVAVATLTMGLLLGALLVPFTAFHVAAVLGTCNTKMVLRPAGTAPKRRLHTASEFREVFCMPLKWRDGGSGADDESEGESSGAAGDSLSEL